MQKVLAAIAALGLAVGMSTVARANIVYTIDQSSTVPEVTGELSPLSDTINGTITTDGTLGVLQSNNILSYNLQINDNLRPDFDVDLTPANSGIVEDVGNGLSASATALSFDFSDDGMDVWNALAIAICVMRIRKTMLELCMEAEANGENGNGALWEQAVVKASKEKNEDPDI